MKKSRIALNGSSMQQHDGGGEEEEGRDGASGTSPRRSRRLAMKRDSLGLLIGSGQAAAAGSEASSELVGSQPGLHGGAPGSASFRPQQQQHEQHHIQPPTTSSNVVVLWAPQSTAPATGGLESGSGLQGSGTVASVASASQADMLPSAATASVLPQQGVNPGPASACAILAGGGQGTAVVLSTAGGASTCYTAAMTLAPSGGGGGSGAMEDIATANNSAAIRSGLLQSLSADGGVCIKTPQQEEGDSCGLWGVLPEELLEIILRQCLPAQLAMLESTCHFFHDSKLIEKIAKHKLKGVPRARGLRPSRKDGETYTMLLHYVNCQSAAAAQATAIACGAYHTSALLIPVAEGEDKPPQDKAVARHCLYTCGRGFHGQLGDNGHESQKSPVQVSLGFKPSQDNTDHEEETMPAVVACGAHHSTAISRKGELYSWGLGCHGELGLGRWGPIELAVPRQCSSPSVRIVSVACGANHTLAIAEAGTLWSCGKNRHGQLGNTTMVDSSRLQMVMHLSGYRIVSSAAGNAHSLALASDGSLFTWGDGSRGQLGHSQLQSLAAMMPANNPITMPTAQKITRLDPVSLSPEHRVTAVAAGAHFSMALTVGGSILAFGANDFGQLGTGDTTDRWKPTRVQLAGVADAGKCLRVVQLACGQSHSVALLSCQGVLQVRTAGCNSHGQLGHGDRMARAAFTPIPKLSGVVAVQAGDEHSASVTASGDLYLWGRGDSGQLGLADTRAKWKPTLLREFKVVHPDKTLRRNKRNQPFTRPVPQDAKQACHVGVPLM